MSMPIYSQRRGCWQFDTIIPKDHNDPNSNCYLWFTNVNTKMTRAYAMKDKSAEEVSMAMSLSFKDNSGRNMAVDTLECDKDPAYKYERVLNVLHDNRARMKTISKTSKHTLCVVNRSIKTIRNRIANMDSLTEGKLGNMPIDEVNKKLAEWNTQPQDAFDGKTPIEDTSLEGEDTEIDIIATKMMKAVKQREKALKGIHEGQIMRRFDPDAINKAKQHALLNMDQYNRKIHKIDKTTGKLLLGCKDPKQGLVQVPRANILTSMVFSASKLGSPAHEDLEMQVEAITDGD